MCVCATDDNTNTLLSATQRPGSLHYQTLQSTIHTCHQLHTSNKIGATWSNMHIYDASLNQTKRSLVNVALIDYE